MRQTTIEGKIQRALIFSNKGFTLVELLVALTVLAIGLLGVLGMQVFAIRGNAFASNMSIAQNLAQQKIEFYKNMAYGAIWKNSHVVPFGTQYEGLGEAPYQNITEDVLPLAERFLTANGTLTANDHLSIDIEGDIEDYGGDIDNPLKKHYDGTVLEDGNGDGVPDPPFDRFRRVTLIKVINGSPTDGIPDYTMVIKVIVFWKGPEGVESRVVMMTAKGLGG